MPSYNVLVGYPLRQFILANYKPKFVVIPEVFVDVAFEDPAGKLAAALTADPLLHQKMVKRVQELASGDLAKLMASRVAMTDLNIGTARAAGNVRQALQHSDALAAGLNEIKNQIVPKIALAGTMVVSELAAKRKEYRNYQIKAGVSISLGVVGVGAGVATIALSAGGSSLISLIAIVRGLSEIIQQCVTLYAEAEKIGLKVHGSILNTLKTQSSNKDVNAVLEMGRAAVKSLTTFDLVSTPAKCKDLNENFGMKLKGLDVNAHNSSEKVNKLLEGADALGTYIRPHNKKIAADLEKTEGEIHGLLEKIVKLSERVEVGETQNKFYAAIIAEMQKGVASWAGPAALATKLVMNVGIGLATGAAAGAIDGSAVSGLPFAQAAEHAQKGAEGIANVAMEALGEATDITGMLMEIAEQFGPETVEEIGKEFPDLTVQHVMPAPPVPPRPKGLVVKAATPPPVPPRPIRTASAAPPLPPLPPRPRRV